ncbi:MAG TPA: hypothetical protein PLO34_10655, partial [Pseudoxanthomonas sp.]|nr:hypothetical protein [Pseudoxanthomonas sp.]
AVAPVLAEGERDLAIPLLSALARFADGSDQPAHAVAWQAQAPGRWLLVEEDALEACLDRERIELAGVANRRRWWLVPPGAVAGECVATETERERAVVGQARE